MMINGMDEWQDRINAEMAGPPHPDSPAALRTEIERLWTELDGAVSAVRRWHRAALTMRDMSITGDGSIQDYYFDAAMSIPFYGALEDPLPSGNDAYQQKGSKT